MDGANSLAPTLMAVPSPTFPRASPQVTVGLLQDAMERSGKTKILIDGFPRNDSNREVFQSVVGYDCELVLFFDCPEAVLEARLLGRNQVGSTITLCQ
jgi:adenylate kinase family enzyme